MSYISIHDQPGTFCAESYFPGVAAKANGGPVFVFKAPFKCVLGTVYYRGTAEWAASDTTNYENLVLYSKGVNGTATATALGTIVGSVAGTVSVANVGTPIYTGGTTQYPANTVFVGSVGTIAAGSVAVPGGQIEVYFAAC